MPPSSFSTAGERPLPPCSLCPSSPRHSQQGTRPGRAWLGGKLQPVSYRHAVYIGHTRRVRVHSLLWEANRCSAVHVWTHVHVLWVCAPAVARQGRWPLSHVPGCDSGRHSHVQVLRLTSKCWTERCLGWLYWNLVILDSKNPLSTNCEGHLELAIHILFGPLAN